MARPLPSWQSDGVDSLRAFSRIRLVAVDLDGTLLEAKATRLYDNIRNLHRSLVHRRHDVAITLATGRALFGIQPIVQQLSIPRGMPLILSPGGLGVRHQQPCVLLRHAMGGQVLEEVLRRCKGLPVRIFAYFFRDPKEDYFGWSEEPELVLGWTTLERPARDFNGLRVCWQDGWTIAGGGAPVTLLIDVSLDPQAAQGVLRGLSTVPGITCTQSGSAYVEVRPRGSDKGEALRCVAKHLELAPQDILAIGDGDNDSDMLAWAGIGVAVAEASPAALASSSYVCRYGAARGAIEVLRLVKHARRYYYRPMPHTSERRGA